MDELDLGWQIIEGKKNVLIVAGHNFEHGRKGVIKYAEWGTGKLVRELCEKYGYFGIVSTKENLDPNWYFSSNFREKIREIVLEKQINLIVDIHGSGMQNEELVYLRENSIFKDKYGQKVFTKDFVKNDQLTLAEEFDNKIAAVEVEIREDGRIPTIDEVKYMEAQNIINDLMKKLNES